MMHGGEHEHDEHRAERARSGAAACDDLQRSSGGCTATARRPSRRRRSRPRRSRAARAPRCASRSEQHERADAAQRRDDDERQRTRREPVEDVARRRRAARRCRRTRRRPATTAATDGPAAEVLDHRRRRRAGARPTRGTRRRGTRTRSTARTPPRIDVGLTQLAHGSPASPPAGTRPGGDRARRPRPCSTARAPTRAANAAPKLRRSRVRNTALRNAKLEPRSTMPSAASVSGTNSVSVIEANASEKPVHSTTRQKISQTWFASHTGPIEWSIERARPLAARRRRRRRGPRSRRRSRRRRRPRRR